MHSRLWNLIGLVVALGLINPQIIFVNILKPNVNSTDTINQVLVDDTTQGYYSSVIGTLLSGTQTQFPPSNTIGSGEPNLYPALEPDVSSTQIILGNWLSPHPQPLNPNWSGIQNIPKTWISNTSVAIIYPVDGGITGIKDITGSFGVDNGLFVWINGQYKFGAIQPGAFLGLEYNDIPLGDLRPGMNYIEIILEDHGQITGFSIKIETGKTANSSILLPNIPYFSQSDPSWNGEKDFYAFTTDKISRWGCNLTSHAMVFNYYAKTYNPGYVTNPLDLNTVWVNNLNNIDPEIKRLSGYTLDSLVNWDYTPNYASELIFSSLERKNLFETDEKELDAALFSGNPAIMRVKIKNPNTNEYTGDHFIVATGKTIIYGKSTYLVNDPTFGQGNLASMAEKGYYYGFQSFVSYQPNLNKKVKELSPYSPYILIFGHSPIHFIITDPLGRRLGFDPRIDQSWDEISKGSYVVDTITTIDGESLPNQKLINISFPINGEYLLTAVGVDYGPYEIDVSQQSGNGSPILTQIFGTAQPSSEDLYTISYKSGFFIYLPITSKN